MLEADCHEASSFVTLTFEKDMWELDPRYLQLFMKRLRRSYPKPLRFYGVGEYGELHMRPHFHIALFGYDPLEEEVYHYVEQAWTVDGVPLGFVDVGLLEVASAAYIAGYVLKKMTNRVHEKLEGRHPEFCRMSLRPGIGAGVASKVIDALAEADLRGVSIFDVPTQLRVGGKMMPVGRYLQQQMRLAVGREKAVPRETLMRIAFENRRTWQERDEREKERKAHALNAEARSKIIRKRRKL